MNRKRVFCLIFILPFFGSLPAQAGKLEKAFERLNMYDYFNAKKYFEKCLKKETAAASFGLSKIYSVRNNPFYDPDEAWKFIHLADSSFRLLKEKNKKQYLIFGITDSSIKERISFICNDAFLLCKEKQSVEAYLKYIKDFSSCAELEEAYPLRDSLAFVNALKQNTAAGFNEFMSNYPEAKQRGEAKKKYDERIYVENTLEDDLETYESFIKRYPENPYRPEAERKIFTFSVPDSTIEEYASFVRKYKSVLDTKDAWNALYTLFMKDYTIETYNNFKDSFPDFPYKDEFEMDFRLQNYYFLPITEGGRWGYINEYGKVMIEPVYEEANFFSDRLAAVNQDGKYGFINKAGEVVVNFQFNDVEPFHHGAAIVLKDSLYGLIDRKGEYLIPPVYEELSETGKDLYIASKNGKYGYIRKIGGNLTPFEFDIARDFKNNFAIVNKDEQYGLINSKGSFVLNPLFSELNFLNDTLLKASNEDGFWGIIGIYGDTILSFDYDAIGDFSGNRALIAKEDKCGYINAHGEVVIPFIFSFAPDLLNTAQFQDGYALVKQKNRSVLIDSVGKIIRFSGCEDYKRPSQGLIPVQKNRKWGYADMKGKIRIPCKYQSADSFVDTLAVIRQNNAAGLIDTSGKVFIQPLYQDIEFMKNAIRVKEENLLGLLSRTGILYFPCRYQKIEFLNSDIAQARDENGFTYINLKSGKIIYSARE